jgi:hypothetical protein
MQAILIVDSDDDDDEVGEVEGPLPAGIPQATKGSSAAACADDYAVALRLQFAFDGVDSTSSDQAKEDEILAQYIQAEEQQRSRNPQQQYMQSGGGGVTAFSNSDAELATSLQAELDEEESSESAKLVPHKDEGGSASASSDDVVALGKRQVEETKVRTCGIASLLSQYYSGQCRRSPTQADQHAQVWLSRSDVGPHHYHQVVLRDPPSTPSDRRRHHSSSRTDGYSCGYRSIQMLCSALLAGSPRARKCLFSGCGFVPELEDLKRWLELAWARGFDVQGGAQLYPVAGKRKWIGSTECWALLQSMGLSCHIVRFSNRAGDRAGETSSSSTHGGADGAKAEAGHTTHQAAVVRSVKDWLLAYFGAQAPERRRSCGGGGGGGGGGGCVVEPGWLDDDGGEKGERERATKRPRYANPWECAANAKGDTRAARMQDDDDDVKQPVSAGNASRVVHTSKYPLYMQHNGHSRALVGISVRNMGGDGGGGHKDLDQMQLLILDPVTFGPSLKASLESGTNAWHSMVKRGLHTLVKPEYEFVVCDPEKRPSLPLQKTPVLEHHIVHPDGRTSIWHHGAFM